LVGNVSSLCFCHFLGTLINRFISGSKQRNTVLFKRVNLHARYYSNGTASPQTPTAATGAQSAQQQAQQPSPQKPSSTTQSPSATPSQKKTYGGLKDRDRIFTNLYREQSPFLDGALKRVCEKNVHYLMMTVYSIFASNVCVYMCSSMNSTTPFL
jgi:hypothetical protein